MRRLPKATTRKLLRILIALAVVSFSFSPLSSPILSHAETLLGANDLVNNDTPNATGVVHNVGFVIPANGHAIVPTDYIRITLTNFTDVTAPTSGTGWSGAPIFGVNGNIAYVTGVSSGTNVGIGISGITATNPSDPSDYDIVVDVASDLAGTIIYDSANTVAQTAGGSTTASVTIPSDSATLNLIGFASPGALITFMLNDNLAGTTVADINGNFTKTFTGVLAGGYNVEMYAEDQDSVQTVTIGFFLNLIAGTEHTVSNIVLPPTISVSPSQVAYQSNVTASGWGKPGATITLFVNGGGLFQFTTTVGSDGRWSRVVDTDAIGFGAKSAYAKQIVTGGYQSAFSNSISFTVVNTCQKADLDCDGDVDLVDFSILMYFWAQTKPSNARADINQDSIVNLTDFSIMMFYWTG